MGLSAGEWARSRGIDGRSLHAWQMNLARSRVTSAARRCAAKALPSRALVELVPVGAGAVAAIGARYVLGVAGVRVEFGDDASAATLRRVLEALRPC
jgi:hypothetical protein